MSTYGINRLCLSIVAGGAFDSFLSIVMKVQRGNASIPENNWTFSFVAINYDSDEKAQEGIVNTVQMPSVSLSPRGRAAGGGGSETGTEPEGGRRAERALPCRPSPGVARTRGGIAMGDQDAFERTLASLHDAMLDDTRWPGTSALIDEACGLTGNDLIVSEGPKDDRPGALRRGLLPGAATRRPGARLPRELLSHRRTRTALPATARQSSGARRGPVHGRRVEDFAHLQRDAAADRRPGQHERASRRAGRLLHHLGPPRSGRLGWLGIVADRDGQGAAAPYPAVRPCPPGAGPRRGAEHDRDRAARQPAGRRPPAGPAWADHRGQRPRPAASCGTAMGWRTGTGRCAHVRRPTRSVSSGWWDTRCRPPARPRSVGRCCSAARPCCRRS